MTQPTAPTVTGSDADPDQHDPTTRDRVPAQAAIERALRERVAAGPRTRLERWLGIDPVGQEGVRWYDAAIAERAVAHRLAGLPSGWTAYHSVPVARDGGELDHLVVGPAGVFTIDVRDRRDPVVRRAAHTVVVAGDRAPLVLRAEARAAQVDRIVADVLADAPVVRPVVVVAGARRIAVRGRATLAAVLRVDQLRRHLRHQPDRFTAAEVALLAARFDDPRTWQPGLEAGPELLLAFGRLAHEMRVAARVRAAWATGLVSLTAAGAAAMLLPGVVLLLG